MEDNNEKLQEEKEGSQASKTTVGFPNVKKEKKSRMPIFVGLFIIILLGAGGWWFLGRSSQPIETEEETSPLPTFVEETPTSTPKIERDEIDIQILNGTGIPQAAASLQESLESMGYSSFDVGNSSSQNYSSTEVVFDSGISSEVREEITEKLKEIYQSVEVESGKAGNFDIKITTGYPKGYTPSPTVKPTETLTPSPTQKLTPSPTTTPSLTPSPTP